MQVWNEEQEKIAAARVALGISVENGGIPMESNEVAFITSNDGHTPSGDIRTGATLAFLFLLLSSVPSVPRTSTPPPLKVCHDSTFADDHREKEQSQASAPALVSEGV